MCTVHRTVISVERFAIASAGFLVLFASFGYSLIPFRERNNVIRLLEVRNFVL